MAPKSASTGPLWALLGASLIALAGLSWWSFQQISLMEQQLVATQESFARISEDAAGRLQDISGKVVATESSVTGENEALKLRLKQLENKLAELGKQQQTVGTQQGAQGKRLEQLAADVKAQVASAGQLDSKLKALDAGQVALKAGQAVGLLPDQVPPDGQGVWAPFFGRDAYTMTLSARLAQAGRVQILLSWGERLGWGRGYRVHVRPFDTVNGGPLSTDPLEAAAQINRAMESLVRECPAQYLWSYDRYKAPRGSAPRPR